MAKATVTAVIVSKGLESMLRDCTVALSDAIAVVDSRVEVRVVVVDNGSEQPYEIERLPGVNQVIRLDDGRSFSAASNLAARSEPSDLILLLNNDVFLHSDALVEMLDLISSPSVGVVGARLVFPDRTIQHCGVVMTPRGPHHDYRLMRTETVSRAPRFVPAVTGAAMLIRSELFRRLGGLSEEYNFGSEDIDFCLRARQEGFRIACAQAVDSVHLEGQTPGRISLDGPARLVFSQQWEGRYSVDGE
ncbi:MAG: glycosyltransferase [Actinobacteria bacterium]|uniref:Unannotated protein n=1 Tax=freshwater metagenome TaxID=449393 RepID=A0A6J5ZGA5_9ZZZZ|nr:glycosyltransferase [Actinomycetota bacterium]